ncbi:MAG TPA: alkaline phosphatase family protein [Candidatus Cybelea sp.]|jgi:phospholipase C
MRVTANPASSGGLSKIDHIVIVIQENRSFNNLFEGFPNAATSKTGACDGQTITLSQVPLATGWDISHAFQDAKTAVDYGKMDGFCHESSAGGKDTQYSFVREKDVAPYWKLAQQYALGDKMFASQLDGSFVAHQYLIAGQAGGAYYLPNYEPWGCDGNPDFRVGIMNGAATSPQGGLPVGVAFPCFTYKSIADELDAAGLSWRSYSPRYCPKVHCLTSYSWDGFDAIKDIREGPDWKKDVVSPETQILRDVKKGKLADVTWVIPSDKLSDHAGSDSKLGPSWVASIVNTIGESGFWPSTAIFVVWDDWGGWYDGVAPPQLDWDGLGVRVPLLCISPYAKSNYVDHTQYEFGSLLKIIESRFDLPSLGQTDARAAAPTSCFDFSRKPRAFTEIPAPYPAQYLIAHHGTGEPDNQ